MSAFGGLLILSLLIIHNNLGGIKGSPQLLSRGSFLGDRADATIVKREAGPKPAQQWGKGKGKNKGKGKGKGRRIKLDRGVIDPKAAYGFLTLNSSYNKYESPDADETRVGVWMEPTFVIEIDSMAWRMGLEIKLEVTWQDGRISLSHFHTLTFTLSLAHFPFSHLNFHT